MKNSISGSSAHSNLIYAFKTFDLEEHKFSTPFRDIEKIHRTETDLWLIGNITIGILDLFYGINKDYQLLKFSDDFLQRLHFLEATNKELGQNLNSRHQKRMDSRFRENDVAC